VMVIPDYHEAVARSKRHDPDSWFEDEFDAFVAGAVETDLGFAGRSFLVAAISIQQGGCDACYSASLMAIDLQGRTIFWRSDPYEAWLSRRLSPELGGDADEPPVLRAFPMFPDDPVKTLAFRFGSEDPFHYEGSTDEHWLRPRMESNGVLTFDTVWEATVGFGTSGIASFTWPHEMASEMTSLWPRHAYRFTRHTIVGWDTSSRSVDLITSQEFLQDPRSHKLASGPTTMARKDQGPVSTFPFNLPIADLVFDPAFLPAKSHAQSAGINLSPAGELFAERVASRLERPWHLRLCRAGDGVLLRDVWSGVEWPRNSARSEMQDGLAFEAIGWTGDGARCLAIVSLGLYRIPPVLVSLTPNGKGDRWEGFLPDGYVLPDGFILDLPEADSKPVSVRTKP